MSEISITKIFPFLFLISCFSFITQAEVSAAPGDNNDLQDQQKKVAGKGAVPPVEVDSSGDLRRENPYRTEAEVEYPVHIHVFWESRYVTEGRDNLLGDGLLSLSTDISYGNFTFAPWFADSPDTDYRELNLNFVYGFKIGKAIEFYTAYSYLEFDTTDESGDDDEIGAGLVYTAFGSLDVITSWFYSFEAEGSYFELGAIHERPITDNFFLSLGITTGINDG